MALCIYNPAGVVTYGNLDLFLSDLDKTNGKISCCQEVRLIQSRVRKVIRSILLEVRRENPFFRTTLINSGSFYEGTKVGQPDEFDYLIQLDGFSSPEDVRLQELPCSTLGVLPSESAMENVKFYFPNDWGFDFEWKKSIKTPFCKIFNKKAEGFEAYGMKVVLRYVDDILPSRPLARHGPAYTLLLEWNGGEQYKGLRISVHLSLAVKINSPPNNVDLEFESPAGRVLKSLVDNMSYYFAVGSYRDVLTEVHPNYFAEYTDTSSRLQPSNFCLRCSQSCFEEALFLQEFGPDSGQSRCLRLLKVLRDIIFPDPEKEITNNSNNSGFWNFDVDTAAYNLKDTGKLISSYVLKTLVLFEWQQNPADELWSGNNLSQRLLSILYSLVDHLKQRKLRSFFYADYNIFPSSNKQEMDFLNAASIVSILLDGLLFIGKMKEYNFGECMKKIREDSVIVYRKKSFTSLLLDGFWVTLFDDSYLNKAVEQSIRKEGQGQIYSDVEEYKKNGGQGGLNPGAIVVMTESAEKYSFYDIYVQALLDEIAPEETLILTSTNVKETKSLNRAGQLFKKIARRRMAASQAILPSYSLWSQEIWRLEESVYKYTTDEPKKLMDFLFDHFREDIKILLRELTDC